MLAPILALVSSLAQVNAEVAADPRPRLVVLISVDQLRYDYLLRYRDRFLSGTDAHGFRWLMNDGASFGDAHHDHYPLVTAIGHAALLTGALPYKSGIVGNDWYDRKTKLPRYCVKDATSPEISPLPLLVTTVGDELAMATGGRAKVWAIALKDRAAVLMAGRLKHHHVVWFSEATGRWETSSYYPPLPAWFEECQGIHDPVKQFESKGERPPSWVSTSGRDGDASAYGIWNRSDPEHKKFNPYRKLPARTEDKDGRFVYDLSKLPGPWNEEHKEFQREDYFKAFDTTPFANEYVLSTALRIVQKEGIGVSEPGSGYVPSLLAINLSTNDYVGHAFGPESDEIADVTIQTDRQLSAFFRDLAACVEGGLSSVVVVVTADHGVALNATLAAADGLHAGSYPEDDVELKRKFDKLDPKNKTKPLPLSDSSVFRNTVEGRLDATFEEDDWTEFMAEANLYLNAETLARHPKIDPERVEEVAASAIESIPGVYAAYGRHQILRGMLPDTDIGRRVARSFHPKVSGDVFVVFEPGWEPETYKNGGATHGAPYTYDTHIPLLFAGRGIRGGAQLGRASTLDIAPTLCQLLEIPLPSGSEGRVLAEALAPVKLRTAKLRMALNVGHQELELIAAARIPGSDTGCFELSGLAFCDESRLYAVNDKARCVYRIPIPTRAGAELEVLQPVEAIADLGELLQRRDAWYDLESIQPGIDGTFLIANERRSEVIEWRPGNGDAGSARRVAGCSVRVLGDLGFDRRWGVEGVCLADGRLLFAKEQGPARLLETSFPSGEPLAVYESELTPPDADLCDCVQEGGTLFLLNRNGWRILLAHREHEDLVVRAIWSFAELRKDPRFDYVLRDAHGERPDWGVAEALALDGDRIVVGLDNNNSPLRSDSACDQSAVLVFRRPKQLH